ncbi:MAG: Arm DNA-binding domain-containing protein [Bacteroides cellulosilyticus]|nr:Arm DNA-binding domain-containing protein [Bacteroides cellulosilyticus]
MRSTFKVLFYLKRNKEKSQPVVPVMGRITVNGTIAQFSAKLTVPEQLWEVRGGRAKGRSLEADRINRHLDNIRTQIEAHYREICDRETYVTAEKVKNAWQGFGQRYKTLLDAFQHFADNLSKRVGIDRAKCTWYRYNSSIRHLRAFMQHTYRVSDMPLAELE